MVRCYLYTSLPQPALLHDVFEEFIRKPPSDTPVLSTTTSVFTKFSKQSNYSNNSNLKKKGRRQRRRLEQAAQQLASTKLAQRINKTNGRLLAQDPLKPIAILPHISPDRKSFVAAATCQTLQQINFPVDSVFASDFVFDSIFSRSRPHRRTSQGISRI